MVMKNLRIATQVGVAFALMVLMVLICGAMIWVEARQSEERATVARRGITGAVALADGQSALWQLRYGFPQFMIGDEASRKKIIEDEPKYYGVINKALANYAASKPSEEEQKSLKALQEIYGKYIAARPKWFELYGAGKLEEAKEWRAATTTPFGAGMVKAFTELIDLQQKVSNDNHEAGLQELADMRRWMFGIAALAVLLGVALSVAITRGLRRQLGGEPAYAKEVAGRIAAGDLASEIRMRADDTSSVLWAMKKMRDDLRAVVADVAVGAQAVSETSTQIAQGNIDLSQRTEEQSSTLEETASSMEELTSTVAQNAQNANQASQLAVQACEVARRGGEVVGEVVTTMTGITESSKKISDIISVIDSIAFQTNILALNAAVEAARAGEQGRGFAVVATEVRNLAQRSAAAAKEIKGLIGASVVKVDQGSKLVDAAGRTMEEIVTSVKQVTDLISEIAAASQEQSTGIGQVNQAITQMELVVQQNASLVEEAAAATESMQGQASSLRQLMTRFQLGQNTHMPVRQAGSLQALSAARIAPAPVCVKPSRSIAAVPRVLLNGHANSRTSIDSAAWKEF
jgi:methyl-accepting chemotaxis protein